MNNRDAKKWHLVSAILFYIAGLISLVQGPSRIMGILFICLGAAQTALAVGKSDDDSDEK
ncbi:hypothetical protein ACVRWL_09220 [Streptococcus ratti]|uniref:Uncharacterized protein n=3 Tax=Streptococcus ratti TaxID=1341 RepID=A0A7X9LER3_STRRT|nr:hypothetical protein [Streptococcus ratti]EJN94060.1 hypothetical protein SRA_05971 [Streptococcus ratti FA-1 = DSM 20564]NMD49818.1 hypothetical protein [Streptococcus ratti]VEI60360.1 Uncharacterised protein [Streptococcus mutans]